VAVITNDLRPCAESLIQTLYAPETLIFVDFRRVLAILNYGSPLRTIILAP